MRVVWYYPFPHRVAGPVALELVRRGHDLTVLAPRTSGEKHQSADDFGYAVRRNLPEPGNVRGYTISNKLFRQVRLAHRQFSKIIGVLRARPDVVHLQLLEHHVDWITLRLLRLACNARLVGMVHDVKPHVFRLPGRLENWLLRSTYDAGCLDQLIVFHETLAEELTSEFGVERSRVTVVPMFIRRVDGPHEPQVEGGLNVLCLGTLRENKGIDVLIDAIDLVPQGDNVQFTIAGGGSKHLEASVIELADRRRDVASEVGWYSDDRKQQLLMEADVLILPYTSFHSQSGVLRDAYQYGIPLVVTDVGAIGHTVRDDDSGWVVAPNDAMALRDTISHILESPEEFGIKVANVKDAALRHSPEHVADRLELAYGLTPGSDVES